MSINLRLFAIGSLTLFVASSVPQAFADANEISLHNDEVKKMSAFGKSFTVACVAPGVIHAHADVVGYNDRSTRTKVRLPLFGSVEVIVICKGTQDITVPETNNQALRNMDGATYEWYRSDGSKVEGSSYEFSVDFSNDQVTVVGNERAADTLVFSCRSYGSRCPLVSATNWLNDDITHFHSTSYLIIKSKDASRIQMNAYATPQNLVRKN